MILVFIWLQSNYEALGSPSDIFLKLRAKGIATLMVLQLTCATATRFSLEVRHHAQHHRARFRLGRIVVAAPACLPHDEPSVALWRMPRSAVRDWLMQAVFSMPSTQKTPAEMIAGNQQCLGGLLGRAVRLAEC